jgi:hypothetical protein
MERVGTEEIRTRPGRNAYDEKKTMKLGAMPYPIECYVPIHAIT